MALPNKPLNDSLLLSPKGGTTLEMPAVTPPIDPYGAPKDYYGQGSMRRTLKSRTNSMSQESKVSLPMTADTFVRQRRLSHDEKSLQPRRFLIPVEETLKIVLEQEDTDGDFQICITDAGPKLLAVGTAASNGYKSFDIRGTYMISVLLQELAIARDFGRRHIVLDEARLTEPPPDRLHRMIRDSFWNSLTRRIDSDGLEAICADPKNRSANQAPRIYVPEAEPEMIQYYMNVAETKPHLNLQVCTIPGHFDAAYVRSLNDEPGILALAMKKVTKSDGTPSLDGIPFVVPGARFNELYNWDSYFISLGLLTDDKIELAKGIVNHFIFEIKHYKKILNGNRSYYLARSQPPFLTDMALQVYHRLDPATPEENKAWLKEAIKAAIQEYHCVWMSEPRLDKRTGLSRYRPDGMGIPPETESTHFTHILKPYAEKHGISVNEFVLKYNDGEVSEPTLDEYFLHDRAVRESGHDTTYRFEGRCANLATIDLNALLYKFEVDIANAIENEFGDTLELDEEFTMSPFPFGTDVPMSLASKPANFPSARSAKASSRTLPQSSDEWKMRAARRKRLVDRYLWNEGKGIYYDYDTVKRRQSVYESVTTFWAMWAGLASEDQARKMVVQGLPKFEVTGGLVSGTEESRGKISLDRPNRQWDYPYAWPPHQILTWIGMQRYDYFEEASRLAYRWLYMITAAFVDFNGTVPEKFDAVKLSHHVDAEYGNQGVDFKLVPKEGFGWTNASYQLGLTCLTSHGRRALASLTHPDSAFKHIRSAA